MKNTKIKKTTIKKLIAEFSLFTGDTQQIVDRAVIEPCKPDHIVDRDVADSFFVAGIDVAVAFEQGRNLFDGEILIDPHIFNSLVFHTLYHPFRFKPILPNGWMDKVKSDHMVANWRMGRERKTAGEDSLCRKQKNMYGRNGGTNGKSRKNRNRRFCPEYSGTDGDAGSV